MPFDSEWPGDAAAAPFCGTSNREDGVDRHSFIPVSERGLLLRPR
jgi:hypothetical protein